MESIANIHNIALCVAREQNSMSLGHKKSGLYKPWILNNPEVFLLQIDQIAIANNNIVSS